MKILVLGIGNVLFADEGLGVHLCHFMRQNYEFSSTLHSVDFIDGGTLGLRLGYIIADYDKMVLLDCLEANDAQSGDVFFFPFDAIPSQINFSGSAHEVEMLQTLNFLALEGTLPPTHILGFVPKRIEAMSFELSNTALKAAQSMEKTLLEWLLKEGISHKKIQNFTLQELAKNSFKA